MFTGAGEHDDVPETVARVYLCECVCLSVRKQEE